MTEGELNELVEQLKDGVREIGMHEDNNTTMVDHNGASDVMFDAATAITQLRTKITLLEQDKAQLQRIAQERFSEAPAVGFTARSASTIAGQ